MSLKQFLYAVSFFKLPSLPLGRDFKVLVLKVINQDLAFVNISTEVIRQFLPIFP